MTQKIPNNLYILEFANNHMGDINHGIKLIQNFSKICKKYPFNFAMKFQYRALDTFIHPKMKGRNDIKYVKRFSETKLSKKDFNKLILEVRKNKILTIATPFDQESVKLIENQNLDIIKIASCSFTDWPLIERIIENDKPIIASTAGAIIEEIDQVVSFFTHRKKDFAIMHCVGEYPTPNKNTHLSQLKYLQSRYPNIRIGFSTHEDPNNITNISMAIAMGAQIFERHVGLPTKNYNINNYSSTPNQFNAWLKAAYESYKICGIGNRRPPSNKKERNSLKSLQRGTYLKRNIKKGEAIENKDVYFAFPPEENQLTANNWSKYNQYIATQNISKDSALKKGNFKFQDTREKVWKIVKKVRSFLKESKSVVPGGADLEISHHYGLNKFDKYGLIMLNVINRNYCKKLLVILPGQKHPEQYHNKKEETFHILYGKIQLKLNGKLSSFTTGDVITILPKVKHSFSSKGGAVIEEISTTHYKDDSYYTDKKIMKNKQRKTLLTYWME